MLIQNENSTTLSTTKSLAIIHPIKKTTNHWVQASTKLIDKLSAVPSSKKLDANHMPKVYVRRDSIVLSKVPNEYDVKLLNLDKRDNKFHYRDHQGNFITRTGHVIDDYAIPMRKPADDSTRYKTADGQQRKTKMAL